MVESQGSPWHGVRWCQNLTCLPATSLRQPSVHPLIGPVLDGNLSRILQPAWIMACFPTSVRSCDHFPLAADLHRESRPGGNMLETARVGVDRSNFQHIFSLSQVFTNRPQTETPVLRPAPRRPVRDPHPIQVDSRPPICTEGQFTRLPAGLSRKCCPHANDVGTFGAIACPNPACRIATVKELIPVD